jgi:putative phosphoesterase
MVGVMADSHDNLNAIRSAVRFLKESGCSLVVHSGDFIAPFAARELEMLGCPVKGVFGNCDGEKTGLAKAFEAFGRIQEAPYIFDFEGLNILITHLNAPLEAFMAKQEYDLIIYGHTHKPDIRRLKKTLVVNPGETGGWLTGKSTVALVDPAAKEAEIIVL